MTAYGDISPAVAGHHAAELLKRAIPHMVLEKFGQSKPLPNNSTKVLIFSRYSALSNTPAALTEGVTPAGKSLTKTDITVTMQQYGDFVQITDQVMDMHDDPVLAETQEILGEQAGQMLERVRFNVLKAGTTVYYANGVARNAVNTVITRTLQRRVMKGLRRQNARTITSVVRSTPSYGTVNIKPAFVAVGHTDLQSDIEDMTGFKAPEDYGSLSSWENEIGAVGQVRYLTSTLFSPFADAGGAKGSMESTTGVNADVYPVIYIGKDSYACVPLKGKAGITPFVVNPKPTDTDPLAQRGHAGWKAYHACVILNDAWLARAEVACTA